MLVDVPDFEYFTIPKHSANHHLNYSLQPSLLATLLFLLLRFNVYPVVPVYPPRNSETQLRFITWCAWRWCGPFLLLLPLSHAQARAHNAPPHYAVARKHTQTHANTRKHTQTHARTRKHTQAHASTRKHTQAHASTQNTLHTRKTHLHTTNTTLCSQFK
jgi:hypothetical protein